jgi:hypothetical protein
MTGSAGGAQAPEGVCFVRDGQEGLTRAAVACIAQSVSPSLV